MQVERLYDNFVPEHYNLILDLTNFRNRTFSGIIKISGHAKNRDFISLHAKDLQIISASIDNQPIKNEVISQGDEIKFYLKNQQNQQINFSHNSVLEIKFEGEVTDSMHGIYPCYYKHDGQTKELIATQFESHHAREVFPCVDEPEAKATFDLEIIYKADQQIVGNTPILKSNDIDSCTKTTTFETTPKMSTYLLAFVIGELHKKTALTKNGIETSVYATPAQSADLLDFPLDIAVRSLDFYEEYFGVRFPLKKCDHVALPDFSSGAMENWGLITYRESALLAGNNSSLSSKRYVATVIAHELAHQWFGNLVTMKWWDDLWLNESFATMIEYLAVDALEPDWNIWQDFVVNESTLALRRDSIDGVQSVWTPVNHPDEIGTLFDGAIVYAKGARLINMLRQYLGKNAFRAGLKDYFNKFAYKNTIGEDLWQSFSANSNKNIADFMDKWLKQSGFPIVTAAVKNGMLHLEQDQFFIGEGKNQNKLWPILLSSNSNDLPVIFDKKDLTINWNDDFLQLNIGNVSHFITNYDNNLYKKLLKNVSEGKLDTVSRLQLLQERSLLARGNRVSSADLVRTIRHYKDEQSLAVWDVIGLVLSDIKVFVEADTPAEAGLKKLIGDLASKQFKQLGLKSMINESEEQTQLRPSIVSHMIYSQDKTAINDAYTMYCEANKISDINSEIRPVILSSAVRHYETPQLIDDLINEYKNTSDVELKGDIMSALTATKNEQTAELLLNNIMDSDIVRSQDILHWYLYLLRNEHSREKAWTWLRENWSWVKSTFAGDKSYNDFPRYSSNVLKTSKHLEEFNAFFGPMKDEPSLTRSIEIGQREIEARVNLIARDKQRVEQELLS